MTQLTKFQHRQLLSLHFNQQFICRSDTGHRWPAAAWRKMIDRLEKLGYMDKRCLITQAGEAYLAAHERIGQ